MNHSKNAHFEYVFYFLFRTYLWVGNQRWEEPPLSSDQKVLHHGIRFEEDKRLFRRDVSRGEPLEKWDNYLRQSWQQISQIYTDAFGDATKAQQYCQKALFGVAVLILDDGDSVAHHTVTVPVVATETSTSELNFVQSDSSEALFRLNINGAKQTAVCHRFQPVTSEGQAFFDNLQLQLHHKQLPRLAPLEDSEAAPNPAFLVYGFNYSGNGSHWKTSVESILIGGSSELTPLLSPMFTRLIMERWQFMRIDATAKKLRSLLQDRNTYYAEYAHKADEMRPQCARTRLLEQQLQEMHSLNTQAQFVSSRIQGALRTLEINANNLADHLERVRRQAQRQLKAQLQYHLDEVPQISWQPAHAEIPLLATFKLSIDKLQDHQAYITQQVKYLDALRDKWLLYLDKRKTQLGEYLNTLGTVLVFLIAGTTGAVTLNVNKGILGLNFAEQRIYLILIAVLLIPILWRFVAWGFKAMCCILHGTWLNQFLCRRVMQRVRAVEIFSWFKKQ